MRAAGPLLDSYVVDMASLSKVAGLFYSFKMGAINSIGEVHSDTLLILLAGVPSAPPAPTRVQLNNTHVQVVMSAPASNGGNPVQSYEL